MNKDDWKKLEQARKERENIIKYYLYRYLVGKDNNFIYHQNCSFGKKQAK